MGIFYALLTASLGICGNIFAKEWANAPNPKLYALAAAFYIAASLVFPLALRHGSLTIINTLAAIVPLVVTVGIGIWYYNEAVSTLGMFGIAFGIVAAVALTISGTSV